MEVSEYRRNYQNNGTYFFTVNLADRKAKHLIDHFQSLRQSILKVKAERPFNINAWVVLPDHMHFLWTMPEGEADYSMRWKAIKTRFSLANRSLKRPIWQHRFWEHTIRSQADFNAHMNYIHINPVKHGYVSSVKDWPFSSFQYWVRQDVYSIDWAGNKAEPEDGFFGE
jgi:putative transposase